MSLKDKITNDIKDAMKAKDAIRLSTLRMMKTALMNKEIEKMGALSEDEELKAMHTLLKQRKDSIEQFVKGGRLELAAQERAEVVILEEYLPQSATQEEIEAAVAEAVAETGASSMREMGAVMKLTLTKLAGKTADGKIVSDTVKAKLQ